MGDLLEVELFTLSYLYRPDALLLQGKEVIGKKSLATKSKHLRIFDALIHSSLPHAFRNFLQECILNLFHPKWFLI